jgi:predicted dehydrogenase
LVGLLVTNLLAAGGCRVMAVDVAESRRVPAIRIGAERVSILGSESLDDEIREWTEGFGADGVVLATASASNSPVEQAIESARDRARIVVVGNTHVELPWKSTYEKELEVRYSRSYGPGRYDPAYEWGGADYPAGYVRWTEQRNFDACLHLMKTGDLRLDVVTTRRVAFSECLNVYRELASGLRDIGVVIEYAKEARQHETGADQGPSLMPAPDGSASHETNRSAQSASQTHQSADMVRGRDRTVLAGSREIGGATPVWRQSRIARVDVIGAGNFARTMLLPHLQNRIELGTVVNNTGLSARHVAEKFRFAASATDANQIFQKGNGDTDAVLIATRHHLHAPLVVAALAEGRDVFVEKPLCLTRDELQQIDDAVARGRGSVQVGFNRRFAPAALALRKVLQTAPGPKVATYRVMSGKLDAGHWYANYAESGGRVLGEACHFLDFFCFLFGTSPVRVTAQAIWPPTGRLPFPDSVTAQVEFSDGSCGQLIYTAEGDPTWPKENCTVFGAGFVGELDNFHHLRVHRGRKVSRKAFEGKGHAQQMLAWVEYLQARAAHPVPYSEARQSMLLTFAVLEAIRTGAAVDVGAEL